MTQQLVVSIAEGHRRKPRVAQEHYHVQYLLGDSKKKSLANSVTSRVVPQPNCLSQGHCQSARVFAIGTKQTTGFAHKSKTDSTTQCSIHLVGNSCSRSSLELLTHRSTYCVRQNLFHRLLRSFATAYCATTYPRNRAYQHLQSSTEALNH